VAGDVAGPSAWSRWLPVVLWASLIALLSGDAFGGDRTRMILLPLLRFLLPGAAPETLQLVHDVVRKLAHPTEYAILGWLAARAFDRVERSALATATRGLALAIAWAALDELHQATLAHRTGAVTDVALDAAGAAVGVGIRDALRKRLGGARPPAAPGHAGATLPGAES
jgi:VanZ family protein